MVRAPLLALPAGSSAAPDDEVFVDEDEVSVGSGCEVVVIVTTTVLEGSPDLVGVTTEVLMIVDTDGEEVIRVVDVRLVGVVEVEVLEVVVGVLVVGGGVDVVGGVLVVGGVVGAVVGAVVGVSEVVVGDGDGSEVVGRVSVGDGDGVLVSGGEAVVGGLVGELVSSGTLVVGDAGGSDVL